MQENGATADAKIEETSQMSFFQRLIGIYFEPVKTFQDIGRKASFLGIFIVISIVQMGSGYTLMTRMDRETLIRKSMESFPIKMSEEMINQAVQRDLAQPQTLLRQSFSLAAYPAVILIVSLIIAAVFLVLFIIMGTRTTFKKSLAVTFWGTAPVQILLYLLSIVFMFVKSSDTLEVDPRDNVASNLGAILGSVVNSKSQPALYSFLSSIDLFSFWMIALLAIGFAATSEGRITTKKAATGVIVLWAAWVLIKVGFRALFS